MHDTKEHEMKHTEEAHNAQPLASSPEFQEAASRESALDQHAPLSFEAVQDKVKKVFVAKTIKESLVSRCAIIAFLTLMLQIPLVQFSDLARERSYTYKEATTNIAKGWGGRQNLIGPALIIPYRRVQSPNQTEYYIVLPKEVDYTATVAPEVRYRGIYHYTVYSAPVTIRGNYELPAESVLYSDDSMVAWDKAVLGIGVSDLKSINSIDALQWNEAISSTFTSGSLAVDVLGPGLYAKAPLNTYANTYTFSMHIDLKGSDGLYMVPVGDNSTISISGDWGAPNFDSVLLPVKRTISEKQFSAQWNVPSVSRNFPQHGDWSVYAKMNNRQGDLSLHYLTAGVNLFEPVPLYQQVERAVKYGVLFIGLTFVGLLSFELVSRCRLHFVQYGLVGVAMCLFYLVLLSLAEHIDFVYAFIAACLVCILMNGFYIAAALRSKIKGVLISVLLAILYGTLYAILQLEEYAILTGTVLIVSMVAGLMFLTRNLGSVRVPGKEGD